MKYALKGYEDNLLLTWQSDIKSLSNYLCRIRTVTVSGGRGEAISLFNVARRFDAGRDMRESL